MNPSINILNELKEISPVVAAISRQLPYQAPEGYFDTLPGIIQARITGGSLLPEVKENVYQAPQGYFDGLAGTILSRIKASEAASPKEELLYLSTVLNSLDKTTPYSQPETYFEELPGNVVSGIKAVDFVNEELENLSPLMSSLKNKQVYHVPVHYFDGIPGGVLERIKHENGRVVAITFRKRVLRYAAAAVIIGMMAAGAWMYADKPAREIVKTDITVAPAVDSIPAELMKTLSDSELSGLADNPVLAEMDATDISSSFDELVSNDATDLLAGMPDETLQQYLEEQSEDNSIIN
jgi:hypothetical protein